MFATSNYPSVMSDPGRKRCRESDCDASSVEHREHRNKRIHCLPLRSSPRSTLEHDPWSEHPPPYSELEMTDSPFYDDDDLTLPDQAATPTPLQAPFTSHLRGQQGEWAGPGPALSNLNGVVNLGHHSSGFASDQCVPRALSQLGAAGWPDLQSNRLPSPITEDDISSDQCMGSLDMMLDDSNTIAVLHQDAAALLANPQQHDMHHPNAMMDIESSPTQQMDVEPESSPPGSVRRGHVRSKHTINSWTWQPGMKKSFSIGYRQDCEKCRLKVPGHFNHIVIS